MYQSLTTLRNGIIDACDKGNISELEKSILMDMSEKIIRHVAVKSEECERMVETMSGKVLETTWEKAEKKGREEERREGIFKLAQTLKELGIEEQKIEDKLMTNYQISRETARAYICAENLEELQLNIMLEDLENDFSITDDEWLELQQ